jgi:hypothetical protein
MIGMIDEMIAIARPCVADPEVQKIVRGALQFREQILAQCRADGVLSECPAPSAGAKP